MFPPHAAWIAADSSFFAMLNQQISESNINHTTRELIAESQ